MRHHFTNPVRRGLGLLPTVLLTLGLTASAQTPVASSHPSSPQRVTVTRLPERALPGALPGALPLSPVQRPLSGLHITSVGPARNYNNASRFTTVAVDFDQALQSTAATWRALRVFSQQRGGLRVDPQGAFTVVHGNQLMMVPFTPFRPGETVLMTTTTAAVATGGATLDRGHVHQFTTAVGGTGEGYFELPGAQPSAGVPDGVQEPALGDVDNDGDLDLVTANGPDNSVSIRFNDGSGTFTGSGTLSVGAMPTEVALGDVDGDGDLDLVTVNTTDATASIRFNNGAGVFSGAGTVSLPGAPEGLALGDVDGDGDLDLVSTGGQGAGGLNTNVAHIRFNNGAGVFSGTTSVGVGAGPKSVALGDIDDDGDLDLATANLVGQGFSFRYNDGAGNFTGGGNMSNQTPCYDVGLVDLSGDGKLDLVASSSSNRVYVAVNNGTGYGSVNVFGGFFDARRLAFGDVNHDGNIDILAAQPNNFAAVMINAGGAGLLIGGWFFQGGSSNGLALGDLDGDSDLDMVTASNAGVPLLWRNRRWSAGITSFTPISGPVGTTVTITGANFHDATAVTFGGIPAASFTVVDNSTIIATVPAGAFTGEIGVTTEPGTVTSGPGNLFTVTPHTWTGAESTVWEEPLNWSPAVVPTETIDALIPGGLSRYPVISATGAGVRDLTIAPGAQLTQNGSVLDVGSDFTNHGTFTANGGNVFFNELTVPGIPPQGCTIGGSSTTTFRYLHIFSPTTLNAPVRVQVGLSLFANLTSNGRLTLLSSQANGTAVVTNDGGTVIGSATVQCWVNTVPYAGLGYHHLSSPVQATTVADLTTTGYSPVLNAAYNTALNPLLVRPYPTLFGFDETRAPASADFTKGWFSPSSTGTPLAVGRGYSAYLNGGTNPDFVGLLNQADVTLTGLTRTGNFTGNTDKSGWHLLGNPFPTGIDWDLVPVPAGMSGAISVWQPTGPNNAGQYLTRAGGVGSLLNGWVPVAQGFFARVTGAGPVDFTLPNAARFAFTALPHYRGAPDAGTNATGRPLLHLALRQAGAAMTDEAFVSFHPEATAAVDDRFDGARPGRNVGVPTLSTMAGDEELAINTLPDAALMSGTRVPLLLDLPEAGSYELTAQELLNLPTNVTLLDHLTGTRYELASQPTVRFRAGKGETRGRFTLEFGQRITGTSNLEPRTSDMLIWPNPAQGAVQVQLPEGITHLEVLDATGRLLRTSSLAPRTSRLTLDLPAGFYLLRAAGLTQRLVVE